MHLGSPKSNRTLLINARRLTRRSEYVEDLAALDGVGGMRDAARQLQNLSRAEFDFVVRISTGRTQPEAHAAADDVGELFVWVRVAGHIAAGFEHECEIMACVPMTRRRSSLSIGKSAAKSAQRWMMASVMLVPG